MKLNHMMAAASLVAGLMVGGQVLAQQDTGGAGGGAPGGGPGGPGGPGGFGRMDPEQMRQRMMDSVREHLDVKDDAEWKLISERLQKVMDAQRELRSVNGQGMMGRMMRPPGGGGAGQDTAGGGQGRRRGGFGGPFGGGEPSAESEALQKAIDDKVSADSLKEKMTKLRDARKDKEAKLLKAQDQLRELLTVRQEATAVLFGVLN